MSERTIDSGELIRCALFLFRSGNLTTRIVYSIVIEVILFILTEVMVMLDTSSWARVFFWITMATVFLLNSRYLCSVCHVGEGGGESCAVLPPPE